jgi:hypothetical protein
MAPALHRRGKGAGGIGFRFRPPAKTLSRLKLGANGLHASVRNRKRDCGASDSDRLCPRPVPKIPKRDSRVLRALWLALTIEVGGRNMIRRIDAKRLHASVRNRKRDCGASDSDRLCPRPVPKFPKRDSRVPRTLQLALTIRPRPLQSGDTEGKFCAKPSHRLRRRGLCAKLKSSFDRGGRNYCKPGS